MRFNRSSSAITFFLVVLNDVEASLPSPSLAPVPCLYTFLTIRMQLCVKGSLPSHTYNRVKYVCIYVCIYVLCVYVYVCVIYLCLVSLCAGTYVIRMQLCVNGSLPSHTYNRIKCVCVNVRVCVCVFVVCV